MSAVPAFRVTLGGRDLTPRIRPRLVSLTLSEKRGEEADQLDLVLDDTDGRLDLPPDGATLSVAIGWAGGVGVAAGLVDKGRFTVSSVEHAGPPDLVTIRARAADFTGDLKVRREKSWRGTTLGAIVAEVAGRHGLKPRCAPKLAGIAVVAKAQSRESDLAFLRRLGREHDAVATIKRGVLILSPVGAGVTPSGRPLPSVTIRRGDGDRHGFTREKREEVGGVTASWHDRRGAEKRAVTVGEERGAKKLSRTYATEADARAAAAAAKGRAARQPVSLSLTLALGRPDLYPEQRATVAGFKPVIDATPWLVAEVTHSITDRGFTTALKLESA